MAPAVKGVPHLTPRKLVGQRFPATLFGDAKIALVGYCPPPARLAAYHPQRVEGQPFIHLAPEQVHTLSHAGRRFVSLAHVYGGPVSSATVEELAYYGIDTILAYGLAGALGTKGLAMNGAYLVRTSFAGDGTTPRYTDATLLEADPALCDLIARHWEGAITPVQAATGDAIYREDDAYLDGLRAKGCDIVHLDSAHLYAAAAINAEGRSMRAVQCGIVSDVVARTGESESALAEMLAGSAGGATPMDGVGRIVEFYVERLAPLLG